MASESKTEPSNYKPPLSERELLNRYERGERFFSRANLWGSDLRQIVLWEANLERSVLCEANLYKADLEKATFVNADLKGADLRRSNLTGTLFSEAVLRDADLRGARFDNTNLVGADLRGADLRSTSLQRVLLWRTNLSGAEIDGLDISWSMCGSDIDFLSAKWQTLRIDQKLYRREDVESGAATLPFGSSKHLRFLFESKRALTGEEMVAARDLAMAFGSIAKGTKLALELAETGERFSVTSRGNYEQAANVGLGILRATQQTNTRIRSCEELSMQITEGIEKLANERDELHSQNIEMHFRTQKQISDLQAFVETLFPTMIEFPNHKMAKDFNRAAKDQGLDLEDVSFEGPIVRFAKRLREIPETPAILFGILAEFAGIPGGFSLGFGSSMTAFSALIPKNGDSD